MKQGPDFTFSAEKFFLEFHQPFSIAHGSRTGTDLVLLKLTANGITSYGEASLPPYLPETQQSVEEFITAYLNSVPSLQTGYPALHEALMHFAPGNFAAKACVDIALCNWFAKKAGIPVWKWLGLEDHPIPFCTYTIGMGTPDEVAAKVKQAEEFQVLKVKLGGGHDLEIIRAVRSVTDKPVCVDVNQGWSDKESALEMIEWLSQHNVLFVEQPLKKNLISDSAWLKERSPLPQYADESVQTVDDIELIAHAFHGINIKLMKCGGITEGLKMARIARGLNMKVLVGSMSETSCGIMAAAQLSSLADYVDLDGPLLTRNNPFEAPVYEKGRLLLSGS